MAHKRLSKMDDYKLVHSSQDIRGHSMMDADGNKIGTVDDLVVNTDTSRVDTIVLDDGQEFSANEIEIDNKSAYLKGTRAKTGDPTGDESDRVVRVYGDAHVQSGVAAFEDYDETYRNHYSNAYDGEGNYADYEPAYRHGYEYGASERYAGRDYDALEPEMKSSYEERHGKGTWDKAKDAVKHSFTHSRTQHREAGVKGSTGSDNTASGGPGSAMRGDGSFSDFDKEFRTHHNSAYDGDYAAYEPAYRHGYRYGTSEKYQGQEYSDVEPELRRDYEQEHGEGTWKKVKGAARHAFTSSRKRRKTT